MNLRSKLVLVAFAPSLVGMALGLTGIITMMNMNLNSEHLSQHWIGIVSIRLPTEARA
jgi:hypothetical protein